MNESPSSETPAAGQSQGAPAESGHSASGKRLKYAATILLFAVILAAGLATCLLSKDGSEEAPPLARPGDERPLDQVSAMVYGAELVWQVPLDSASMPADIALLDDRLFVLDTNNGRVLEIDDEGEVLQVFDEDSDSRLDLQTPMAITAHDGKLYVSNSGAGNIIALNAEGIVKEVITPKAPPAENPLRPIGIAIAPNGHIFLSDPDNHRILTLDEKGRLLSTIGSGVRDSGEYGFNTPGGLSLDAQGNLYVVDMLNYALKKYSPADHFLLSVGEAGDTEGTFSRPKVVAVDSDGEIFVSDTLLVAVAVFSPDGQYEGFIGRADPEDRRSGSIFQAPHGVKIAGDTLYVVDRFAGVFAFRLPEGIPPHPSAD